MNTDPPERNSESIQSIERAAAILEAVAAGDGHGRRLIDIAADTGLRKATAHRILGTLAQVGLVEQDERTSRFSLGLRLFSLGMAAANRYGLADLASECMLRLAERTHDTVYLTIRSGYEAVCVDRVTGGFPIKTLSLNVGDRRPLGVGAGNLAMLAGLPDDEIRTIVAANAPQYPHFGKLDSATIMAVVEESRELGYAFNDRLILAGMRAVGVPVLGHDGRPVAALSVAAITERMSPARRADIVAWLAEEAKALNERLREAIGKVTESRVRRLAGDQPASTVR
ncbi:IclR family transcriptional regulator [Nonomuraea fuscirosea]|uniref:Glycerol operon regulatory protein n=1 Tax=Nonomuraea fuscirosea TaxID=1291556 RepID=A0A2T0MXZ9_9ACTN|nr:IclR family transcriptional regulator [Nonomuraea fuscirosea]PRX64076.1 IclR family transcriptional regulator [Nonomuraea fuscirosea]